MPAMQKQWLKLLSTNSTDTSFAAKDPTATEPTGTGVILGGEDLYIIPFGAGSNNDTFDLKVIGWSVADTLWIPKEICHLSCTLSAQVGVAGKYLVATDRMCDAITINTGSTNCVAPAVTADTAIQATINTYPYEKVEIIFDRTGASSCNVLYARA